ncbi:hypothetical protein HHI36_019301 [Cryptolaemus montrouzieri]|uniref:Uncharacterized protein n=1 Tax=Cryptolaemus montrouzieri TaxID=559131 RepID=A0ABD2P3D1_9CUCU
MARFECQISANSESDHTFNVHAPVKTRRVSRPKAPWMNDEITKPYEAANGLFRFNRSGSEADWN